MIKKTITWFGESVTVACDNESALLRACETLSEHDPIVNRKREKE